MSDDKEKIDEKKMIDGLLEEILLYQEALTQSIAMDRQELPMGEGWVCYMNEGRAYIDRKTPDN